MTKIILNEDAWAEANNLRENTFSPLTGFMNEREYRSVVDRCRLPGGQVWTMPITLEISPTQRENVVGTSVDLEYQGRLVGHIHINDIFKVSQEEDCQKIFGTTDPLHPGVAKEKARSVWRVGGEVELKEFSVPKFRQYSLSPRACQELIKKNGWKKVVGFQTRNPLHRAHEYLQRVALEVGDGLIIQPLVGWKRAGDFTAEAVMAAYQVMVEKFYPANRVLLCTLTTSMRYAGPREAVFHALIRKNYGCTHFIVGRDHAGVGQYYGKYEAQNFAKSFTDLGIEILGLGGPYFCGSCGHIVTENSCPHGEDFIENISGTQMRALFREGKLPSVNYMRNEIAQKLLEFSQKDGLFY